MSEQEEWVKTLADGTASHNCQWAVQLSLRVAGDEVIYSMVVAKAKTGSVVKMLKAILRASFQEVFL